MDDFFKQRGYEKELLGPTFHGWHKQGEVNRILITGIGKQSCDLPDEKGFVIGFDHKDADCDNDTTFVTVEGHNAKLMLPTILDALEAKLS